MRKRERGLFQPIRSVCRARLASSPVIEKELVFFSSYLPRGSVHRHRYHFHQQSHYTDRGRGRHDAEEHSEPESSWARARRVRAVAVSCECEVRGLPLLLSLLSMLFLSSMWTALLPSLHRPVPHSPSPSSSRLDRRSRHGAKGTAATCAHFTNLPLSREM